jgi:hypothetical protein
MSVKGNESLLRARQAFRLLRTTETLRKIDGGELGPIHYWPSMSIEERRAIFSRLPLSDERTVADIDSAFFAAVLYRARDELGNRLFDDSQEAALADCDPDLIRRIGAEMNVEPEPTIEGAEKN